jgi:anti-sigma regulatory factor (Ser/Thr protein kinase)
MASSEQLKSEQILEELKSRQRTREVVDVEEERVKVIIFSCGGSRYAFYGGEIREFLPSCEISWVPGLPEYLPGLINVRGDIESVLDISYFLGEPSAQPFTGLIAMAVREAAINAVLHGNAYDPGKKVALDFERNGEDLVITIRDQGHGLDVSKIPDPLAPENLMKTSGRGIFLIRSFMDEVQINPSQTGTEVKLIKHVHGPAAGGKEASL